MNRLKLLLLVSLCVFIGCSEHPKGVFVINGTDESGNDAELVLIKARENGSWDTIQRIRPQNGKFYAEGTINGKQIYYLAFNERSAKGKIPLMMEDTVFNINILGENLEDPHNFKISGGQLQQIRNRLYDTQRNDFKNLDSIMNLIRDAEQKHDIASKMHYRFYLQIMGQNYDRHEDECIAANADNIIGLSLVFSKMKYLSYDALRKKLSFLTDSMKNTTEGKLLQDRLFVLQKLEPGSIAPDFELTLLDGTTISLHKLEGKIKILDFWASWCGPCRAANPHMKEIYGKYKDKGLTMLGISLDVSKEAWVNAVKADGLEWLQGCNLDGTSGEIAKKYRITGIPRVFILDENNRILGETTNYQEIVSMIENVL